MPRVSKRGGFSDRNGIKPESVEIQLKKFDQRTRIQLQNLISELYGDIYSGELKYGYSGRNTQNFSNLFLVKYTQNRLIHRKYIRILKFLN